MSMAAEARDWMQAGRAAKVDTSEWEFARPTTQRFVGECASAQFGDGIAHRHIASLGCKLAAQHPTVRKSQANGIPLED